MYELGAWWLQSIQNRFHKIGDCRRLPVAISWTIVYLPQSDQENLEHTQDASVV